MSGSRKSTPATRNRTGSELPEHMAAADPSLQDFSREDIAHGKARAPRVPMSTGDLALTVAAGVIPEGMVGYWFADQDDRISIAKAAYWEHVTDSNGANISRASRGRRMYLMAIDKKYYDEDKARREELYRQSVGERDARSLGVEGADAYTPEGESNKIKISSDPFA